jgi:probable rRNA maturation factor
VAVALRVASARARRYAPVLRAEAVRLLAAMGLARCELSIVIVDDDLIRGMNREFRGKDAATDVLSFSQLEEKGHAAPDPAQVRNAPETILGDVVISADTALRQAKAYGVAPRARLRTLLIHGTLHLIGYDHECSAADARRMFSRERELARAIARMKLPSAGKRSAKGRRSGKRTAR